MNELIFTDFSWVHLLAVAGVVALLAYSWHTR